MSCSLLVAELQIHMFCPSPEPFCHGPQTVLHQAGTAGIVDLGFFCVAHDMMCRSSCPQDARQDFSRGPGLSKGKGP